MNFSSQSIGTYSKLNTRLNAMDRKIAKPSQLRKTKPTPQNQANFAKPSQLRKTLHIWLKTVTGMIALIVQYLKYLSQELS